MELNKHRAILYCGFLRCADILKLKGNSKYQETFYSLWMGNWLTDMNQASAFFTILEGRGSENNQENNTRISILEGLKKIVPIKRLRNKIDRKISKLQLTTNIKASQNEKVKADYYQSWKDGKYVIPKSLLQDETTTKAWENLFQELWDYEWEETLAAFKKSKDMGDIESYISINEPINENVKVGDVYDIGAYYPFDHFDVTEYFNGKDEDLSEERELKHAATEGSNFMTFTANMALEHAFTEWIEKAFNETQSRDNKEQTIANRLVNHQALKKLGHGIHTMQDFYAHSNYTDLLLISLAEKERLDNFWNTHVNYLVKKDIGIFNAFVLKNGMAEDTPVVTGRFNTIDTLYTLMNGARESLVSFDEHYHEDHNDENGDNHNENKSSLTQIVFGTFTHIHSIKKLESAYTFFNRINTIWENKINWIQNFILEKFVDPRVEDALAENHAALETYDILRNNVFEDIKPLKDYKRAATLFRNEHIIEKYLRHQIEKAEKNNETILPHHTLLAKDHDRTLRAVKLSFKLACALSAEVTTELLTMYFRGESFEDAKSLFTKRYKHPKYHFNDCVENDHLLNEINKFDNGWFRYASKNPERRGVLGYELNYLR